VVIADEPLTNFIPLYKAADSDDLVTQYEGPLVEKVGLLKMDFLGLKTLSVLEGSRQMVNKLHGAELDLEKIDITEKEVFDLFARGRTKGVFQFESGGMQDLLMKMGPDRLEDLIAANALYRPGPMTLIPDYIARKHGEKWDVPHKIMHEVLSETYGIMIYQEQVMRISNLLGGIPLREAYTMIKAISKKKLKVIAKAKEKFIEGCQQKGLKEGEAREIFELIERFAGYGFNKSHSTRYAFIAYQTAYMKVHWPIEFMAALLTYEMGNTEKVVDYIGECKDMGIEVLPPDINESGVNFTPMYKGKPGQKKHGVIRFGLAAVKGVGEKAVEQLIVARQAAGKFESLYHFCENVDLRAANKQTIEALIKAGAFDKLGGNRAQLLAGMEDAMMNGARMQEDKQNGQMNFFGQMAGEGSKENQGLPNLPPWPESQMLAYEKEVLGFYVTSNPLSHCAEMIDIYSSHNSSKLDKCQQDQEVVIGGMVTKIRSLITKKGKNAGSKMAVFFMEDLQGVAEVVLFPRTFKKFGELVVEDEVVFVKGKVDKDRQKPNIFAEELIRLDEVTDKLAAKVWIRLKGADVTKDRVEKIRSICQKHRGKSSLHITLETEHGKVSANAENGLSVNPDPEFCKQMRSVVGEENFSLAK
jgi:DNA polymerase-3 subunit alpha